MAASTLSIVLMVLAVPQTLKTQTHLSLFDGKTLHGWTTRGGRYDGNATWSVENGAITGREGPRHAGGLIYTSTVYSDYVLELDCKITYPFDSGVFLRMLPRKSGLRGAQVCLDYRPNGEVGAIYADGFLQHNKEAKALWKKGEWNHVKVLCRGKFFTVKTWLNGKLITDYKLPEGKKGFAEGGLIGLQVHGSRNDPPGSKVQFKNIFIKELPTYNDVLFKAGAKGILELTEKGKKAEWKPLLQKADLANWEIVGESKGFKLEKGVLNLIAPGKGGYIRTKKDFKDFQLRLDFRIAEMANSGLFLRGDRKKGHPASSGCEIQILDDFNWEKIKKNKLKPWQFTGSLYGSQPPLFRLALKPLGQWNTYEVSYIGPRISVRLNGVLLYDVDTLKLPDPWKKPFASRAKSGFIGLQFHAPKEVKKGVFVSFRNIFVKRI